MSPIRTVQRRLAWKAGAGAAAVAMCATMVMTATPPQAAAATPPPTIKVAMVPKLLGLPVFEANDQGALKVIKKLGISYKFTAPATASAEGQVAIFNSLIAQHYNVITTSSNDPTVPAAVLEKAMKAGIQVVTYDSDVPSARDFFIQDTAYNTIAEGLINATAKFTGRKADIAIMSSTPDATIQLAWIGAMKHYIKARYPGLNIVTIGYGQSNQATSLSQAEGIIHSYPNVKAILPIDGAAVVGTAQAVAALHESGKIGVFGIGDPLPNQKYFANGSLQGLFLWNEVGQGRLVMLTARLAYEGAHGAPECTASQPPANPSPTQWCGIKTNQKHPQEFSGKAAGLPGHFTVESQANKTTGATKNTIIFSKPLEFTKANYKKYKF